MNLKKLLTETRNIATLNLDKASTLEIVSLINQADNEVATTVAKEAAKIAQAANIITEKLKDGGWLFYLGAGTSGRLGIIDAAECLPTYGTCPNMVQGIIAGGADTIVRSIEGVEDCPAAAVEDLKSKELSNKDILVGLAASGRTPYVIGGA